MNAKECQRVVDEVKAWNHNQTPDIVWCIAGSSHPSFFVDASIEQLQSQMDSNFWSSAYVAHAILKQWLAPSTTSEKLSPDTPPRHLIFTSSIVAFYTIAGYSPYSSGKAALRSLCDSLRQEVDVYNGSRLHPSGKGPVAPVKLHCVFPGTIFSPGLEQENLTKPGITKKLEEDDGGQTEEEVALTSVKSLEKGEYLITGPLIGYAMKASALGGSPRNNALRDTLMIWVTSLVWLFVGPDLDGKAWRWGKEKGHPQNRPIGT
jgi:3-dehydrosphinganine reductase